MQEFYLLLSHNLLGVRATAAAAADAKWISPATHRLSKQNVRNAKGAAELPPPGEILSEIIFFNRCQ